MTGQRKDDLERQPVYIVNGKLAQVKEKIVGK